MGNSHQNLAEPEYMKMDLPAKSVVCCRGCTFLIGVPPILRASLDQIMTHEFGEIPQIVDYLIYTLQKPGKFLFFSFLYKLSQNFNENKAHRGTEGIFRTSGASGVINELLEMFNRDTFTDAIYKQPTENYTGILKQFLRQLSPPLIPTQNLIEFCAIFGNFDHLKNY